MKRRILLTALLLSLSSYAAYAGRVSSAHGEVYGVSSEDSGDDSYLGVDTRNITPDQLSTLHLKEESGVEITMVDQDAPAGKAGLKEQDVILTLNGEKVASVEQLRRMIRETPPGRVITLGISRNGQPMTCNVQLADRKNSFADDFGSKMKDFHFEMPAMPVMPELDMPVSIVVVRSSARSGLMVENLTPQLGDFFGTKNGQGVLIRSVEKGSRADKAGFRAGDVIVKINDEPIHDTSDFSHALRSRQGSTASVGILRDKKEQTITLSLPERKQSRLDTESIELPQLDAQASQLAQLESDWNHLEPQMREAINQRIQKIGPEVERATREFLAHQGDFQKAMSEMRRRLCDHQRQLDRICQRYEVGCAQI
ncbi:MAG TPA: PDZ domain-containing protein [Terriglobales bacterium]|nr:PDZ domain-containing protein [Terriglobales bacterium]